MRRISVRRFPAAVVSAVMLTGVMMTAPVAAAAETSAEIEVLSGPAHLVSAGNALLAVTSDADDARILSAGEDVTADFRPGVDGRLVGLVEDLALGASDVTVTTGDGELLASQELVNHPRSGPILSGPQHVLYCQATGLGELDEDCMTENVVTEYRYRTTGNEFADYPTDGSEPTDVATVTVDGETVPYIYRLERGTINRSLYEIAILDEPGTPEPTPWNDTAAWNDKLVYTFGGACGVGLGQGNGTGGVENHTLLSAGYAVASGSLNVYATSCDDVVSAETAQMVKEHFIESFGLPQFAMGFGGSAGTMQQLLLSNNYPGIIDGVIGQIGYSDERTTTVRGHDCRTLSNYWNSPEGAGWTDEEKLAVTGHASLGTCFGYQFFDGVDDPNRGCPAVVPAEDRWSPTNPGGVRCTIVDTQSNVYGVDDEGRGLRVIADAVGIEFGREAWLAGAISTEQFLDLNANLAGVDIDGAATVERTEASVDAIERAFATGRVNLTSGGLAHIPVIEFREYTDPSGDFHDSYNSAVLRERMLAAHGDAGTHVSWRGGSGANGVMTARAIAKMDEWLTNLEALGTAGEADRASTVAARPGDIEDGCYMDPDTFVAAPLDHDAPAGQNPCNEAFPMHADPRIQAGGPITVDVLKCTLAAPERADYPGMTDDEWAELGEIFADGVCDYTQPSQGYVPLEGTWLTFGDESPIEVSGVEIDGQAVVGHLLTAQAVGVTDGASLTYQWLADGVLLEGATEQTFAVEAAEIGSRLTVRVMATAEGMAPRTIVSDATAAVTETVPEPDPDPEPTPDPDPEPTPTLPVEDEDPGEDDEPTAPPVADEEPSAPGVDDSSNLPATGADIAGTLLAGLVLLAAGSALALRRVRVDAAQ